MTTDYFTTERPTNRLPCTKDESKITKCVNKGQCFAVVIKDQRHLACHCPEGFVGRHCEEKRIPSDPSYINSASLLWGLLIVLAVLIFLILIGFVIWRKFFRNQPKSKPVVATAEYDHNKQLIAVKEFENRHYSRPNEESETEPLDHTLDMRDDTFEVTIGTSPNYNRPSPDESHMSAGFHSNGKVTNV